MTGGGGTLINYLFPGGDTWILIKWCKKAGSWVSIIARDERPQGFEESSSTVAADSSNRKCVFVFFAEVVLAAVGLHQKGSERPFLKKISVCLSKIKIKERRLRTKSQQVFSL